MVSAEDKLIAVSNQLLEKEQALAEAQAEAKVGTGWRVQLSCCAPLSSALSRAPQCCLVRCPPLSRATSPHCRPTAPALLQRGTPKGEASKQILPRAFTKIK